MTLIQQRPRGFSLIEVMLALGLLAVVMTTGTIFMRYISSNYLFSVNQYQLTDEATFVVRQIATELRQAEEAMNGAYALELLDDNEIIFYADVDNDGDIEKRRYYLDSFELKRDIVEPSGSPPIYDVNQTKTTLLLTNIDQQKLPLFFYYNDDWPEDQINNPLSYWVRPLETRLIKVVIPVVNQSDLAGEKSFSAESTVLIRNLKDNYE